LKRLWNDADLSGIRADQSQKVRRVLLQLNAATRPEDLNLPGYRFHALHGRPQRYSVTITKNWRITFEWADEDAFKVDYEDYH
jgi:toxin HigB-1